MSAPQMAPTAQPDRPKVLFADDHHLVLDALSFMAHPKYEVRGVDSLQAFEQAIESFDPDVAVLDVSMPDGDSFDTAQRVVQRRPQLKLLFLSAHADSRTIKRGLDAGAKGYVSKRATAEELLSAIEAVLNGGTYVRGADAQSDMRAEENDLTERQKEVLRLIAQGCSAKQIASRLNISVRTAEFHRAAIMGRLRLHSTAMMTRYALEHGLE